LALNYELIEHTADTGIRVKAPDVEGLFIAAGLAIFDIIARRTGPEQQPTVKHFPVKLSAENLDELFVAWLNELISLSAAEKVIISSIAIERLDGRSLSARVAGDDAGSYRLEHEIKAATYHQLKVAQTADGWEAEVIFDV
jgi:SHS2 domain-containing protein